MYRPILTKSAASSYHSLSMIMSLLSSSSGLLSSLLSSKDFISTHQLPLSSYSARPCRCLPFQAPFYLHTPHSQCLYAPKLQTDWSLKSSSHFSKIKSLAFSSRDCLLSSLLRSSFLNHTAIFSLRTFLLLLSSL